MLKKWANSLTAPCPLCGCSARLAQFCTSCHDNILSQQQYPYRCPHCLLALPSHSPCPNCHDHRLSLQRIYHLFDYVPPLDSLVLRFKNAKQPHLANNFAHLFAEQLTQHHHNTITTDSLFIPIPSSRLQLQKRNYNPAGIFAKALAKKLQCDVDLTILRRHESAYLQKSLHRHDRFLHSSQLYYAQRRLSIDRVILVDDILTTGSTLESAARALMSAGVKQVDAIVIARSAKPF